MSELLLYGIPKGVTERYREVLLATGLTSQTSPRAQQILALATKDGFHSFRFATFDGSPPDFTKVL